MVVKGQRGGRRRLSCIERCVIIFFYVPIVYVLTNTSIRSAITHNIFTCKFYFTGQIGYTSKKVCT